MPYLLEEKLIFIHIPKTGGTSIERFFEMINLDNFFSASWDQEITPFINRYGSLTKSKNIYFEPQHYTQDVLSDLILDYQSYFTFTFVRNPYTRLLSEYFWLKKIAKLPSPNQFDEVDFHNWCINYLKEINSSHKIPQVSYLDNQIDFIGRYEKLNEDFKELISILCNKSEIFYPYKNRYLPKKNTTPHDKELLKNQILRKTKKLIYRTYQKDFKLLNYDSEL